MCVPKCDKEEHEAEAHVNIVCPDCAFAAPSFKYANHPEVCKMKPKACEFCEKVVNFVEQESHF